MLNIFKVQKGVAAEQRAGEGFFWAWCLFVRFVRLLFVVCQFVLCLCIRPSGKQNNRKAARRQVKKSLEGVRAQQHPKSKIEIGKFIFRMLQKMYYFIIQHVPGTWYLVVYLVYF